MKRSTFIKLLGSLPMFGFLKEQESKPPNLKDYRAHIEIYLTPNILIPYGESWDTNKRNEFWQFIAEVVLIPHEFYNKEWRNLGPKCGLKRLHFESEITWLGKLSQKDYQKFVLDVHEAIEKNMDKFKSIEDLPNKICLPAS